MNRLTEWIGGGEDRYAIPRQDLPNVGAKACAQKLARYEDLELEPEEVHELILDAADMEAQLDSWKNDGTSVSEWVPNTDDWVPKIRCKACGYNRPVVAGGPQEPMKFCNACGAYMKNHENPFKEEK